MSGGSAWEQDHQAILEHARGLKYDKVPGVNLPSAGADRATWTSAMDAFNSWKAREVAKEASGQAWWQTYQAPGGGGGGDPDDDTGTGPGPNDDGGIPPWRDDGHGPFPILAPDYESANANDWGRWMPRGVQRANVRPGDIWGGGANLSGGNGLLYQPWTKQYGDRYIDENLWDYDYPEFTGARPNYWQVEGLPPLKVSFPEPEDDDDDDEDEDGHPDPGGQPDPDHDNDPNRPDQDHDFGPEDSEDGIL